MARRWFSLSPLAGRGDRVAPAVVAGPAMTRPCGPISSVRSCSRSSHGSLIRAHLRAARRCT